MHPVPVRRAVLLALAASLALPGCGDDAPPPKKPGEGKKEAVLGPKMPEFTPSGIKEDYTKLKQATEATRARSAKTKEDQEAAVKARDALLQELDAKWSGKEVPAQEAQYLAMIHSDMKRWPEAANQCRRFLEIAPQDNVNYEPTFRLLVQCLVSAGKYDEAQSEIDKSSETLYKNRDNDLVKAKTTIALGMYEAGEIDRAAGYFESLITLAAGDVESAIYCVDCHLRKGNVSEAQRVAQKAADHFKEGRPNTRMKELVQQVGLVGKPCGDFSAVHDWKGEGGPITKDMIAGKVLVTFSWNMQTQWTPFMFKRLSALNDELGPKGMVLVGISRLAHFDAHKMITNKDMPAEKELEFYDAWTQQYNVHFPLAVGNYEPDTALLDAWAGHVIPSFTVVGKDGRVCYVRTGKEDKHIAILKTEIEKALAK